MIRNHLFTICSRLKATELVSFKRSLQISARNYQNNHSKNYVEANHELLDVDEVLNDKNDKNRSKKEESFDYNQVIREIREKGKFKGKREFRDNTKSNNSVRNNQMNYKKNPRNSDYNSKPNKYDPNNDHIFKDQTDPRVKQLFINDCKIQNNYSEQLILEGKYVINDVISFGYPKILRIYYTDEEKLNKINELNKLKENQVEFFKISYQLMRKYSDVVTPQGLMAVAEFNPKELFERNSKNNQNELPLIIILNNVRDPGNMGTLIRTSLACGVSKFLCLKKNAKLLKDKVIRSSSATVFKLPFIENLTVENLKDHLPENAKIYIADSKKMIDYNSISSINDRDEEPQTSNETKPISDKFDSNEMVYDKMKIINYLDINYFSKSDDYIVLIVNGETGETDEIQELIKSKEYTRINIPLANDVESLNTGVAASILMFELKRQYLNALSNK